MEDHGISLSEVMVHGCPLSDLTRVREASRKAEMRLQ